MMRTRVSLSVIGSLLALSFTAPLSIEAGVVGVHADAGTFVDLRIYGSDGNRVGGLAGGFLPDDKTYEEFTLSDAQEENGYSFSVRKKLNGTDRFNTFDFTPNTLNMAESNFKPIINLPNFVEFATSPTVASVNISVIDLLGSGVTFDVGEQLVVSNGFLASTSSIEFFDTSGDVYSGTVEVQSFDTLRAVPEPATWMMACTAAVIGFAGALWRRQAKARTGEANFQPPC
jgi:hypothetical protein